jgi:hypothetical protein
VGRGSCRLVQKYRGKESCGRYAGDCLARALAANEVPHTVHVFAHGPHGLGLARGAGDAAIWTTLADAWIRDQP